MEFSAVRVRHVKRGEEAPLREVRLASLAADPEAFGATYARDAARPAEWWERWAAQSDDGTAQRTFVLVDDEDRWVGLAFVRLDEDNTGSAELNAMWVAPEARGRGASRRLCDGCAAWAAERGAHELTLSVVVENDGARRAYEAAGFSVGGTTTWSRHGRSLDVLVMSRPL